MFSQKEYWKQYFKTQQSPEQFVEKQIILFEKKSKEERELWIEFLNYLREERAKKITEIKNSLTENSKDFSETLCRVVLSKFATDPLCSKGSLKKSGRFNCGWSTEPVAKAFPCLYFASNHQTALNEKFKKKDDQSEDEAKEKSLAVGGYSFFNVSLCLQKILDLRNKKSLNDFFDVISKISNPKYIEEKRKKINKKRARKNSIPRLEVIKKKDIFLASLFTPRFKDLEIWLDQPANSQWLGYYSQLSGVEAILYPSIYSDGHNMAVFPESLLKSSYIEVTESDRNSSLKRCRIDEQNHKFSRFTMEEIELLQKSRAH